MASTEAKAKWLWASRPPSSFTPSSSKSESEERSLNDLPPDIEWWSYQQPKANKAASFWNPQWETFSHEDARMQEFKAVINNTSRKKPMLEEALSEDESNKLFSGVESEWFGIKKNEPWWRNADLNDLVLLKSLQHLDNCDLPLPQTNKTDWLVCDKGLASIHDKDPKKEKSSFTDSIRPFSTNESKNLETQTKPISQLSKAELLEALCRSQRRAREAERAAQEAYNEKEHVITLFLKQASHIFAYKQWLYILQLETLCVQLRRRKYHPIYNRFPDFMPWVPTKSKPPKRVHKMDKYIGDLLLGLAIVGAGVLLGWTLGWLLHAL